MSWLEKHSVIRRAVLLWAVWLITVVAETYMLNIGKINAADAAVITGVIGILTVVIGFQRRDKDVG